jgi:hypothetical protein
LDNKELAARLIALEHRAQDLVSQIRELFQEVLDTEEVEE